MKSYIGFRGCGFWCADSPLAVACYLLARGDGVDLGNQPFRDWIDLQSRAGIGGAMDLHLDRFLESDNERNRAIGAIATLVDLLAEAGASNPGQLNSLGIGGPGVTWAKAVPNSQTREILMALRSVLDGTWPFDAADSPTLPTR